MEELANARYELDVAETKLEVIDADLSLKVRSRPKKYGLKSITEPAIKSVILMQPEHKKQKWRIIKKKRYVGYCQAKVTALDHRKKSLEKEVDLHGQGYWSKPRLKGKAADEMDIKRKRKLRHGSNDE